METKRKGTDKAKNHSVLTENFGGPATWALSVGLISVSQEGYAGDRK